VLRLAEAQTVKPRRACTELCLRRLKIRTAISCNQPRKDGMFLSGERELFLAYEHDTYDRRVQLGASRRRREDSECLYRANHWAGAMYLGGYAVECALKALICLNEGKNNFKDTKPFKAGMQGSSLHSLAQLRRALPAIERAISLDRTNTYKPAWDTLSRLWQKDELRYWDKDGNQQDSADFIAAVQTLHNFILSQLAVCRREKGSPSCWY